jgi:hypothetical protein
VTAAGVALLKTEELQLGLDLIHERFTHCCGSVGGLFFLWTELSLVEEESP